jgi:predicted dehydrogenase
MKKYRFGLIGLGVISKYFVSALEKNPQTKLVAVSARSAQSRKFFEKKGINGYKDYRQLLINPLIDVVIVATPNHTHNEIIRTALLARKHVVCEKPLALNTKDAKKLIVLAKNQKLLLFTIFHRRYNKELIHLFNNTKLRKKIRSIYARYLEYIPDHSDSAKWLYDTNKSGGGCVIDNGINVIDVIRKLVGDITLENVHLGMKGVGSVRHDANAMLTYNFCGGKAHIELDWYYKGEVKDIVLYLSDGSVIRKNMLTNSSEFKGSLWHEYEAALKDVLLKLKSTPFEADYDSLKALAVVEEVYKYL